MPELRLVGDDAPDPREVNQRKQPDGPWLAGRPRKTLGDFRAAIAENLPLAGTPAGRNAIHTAISGIMHKFGKPLAYRTMDEFNLKAFDFARYEG